MEVTSTALSAESFAHSDVEARFAKAGRAGVHASAGRPPFRRHTSREICISRESNPGHIDGNDVFYH